uniref:KIB1-4 beta-propeller domain-containing protein n=1 Tax=Aegilops tauschii TaxID=37682 RepID=M8BJV0_AEGTA
MTVMMCHMMHREAGMFFCRPGDVAWTKVGEPNNIGHGYFDLAYHDGKMFGMQHTDYHMSVFDATTLRALQLVGRPPATIMFANKMYGVGIRMEKFDYAHLVALPSKLVLVRTTVKSSRPVAFTIFELVSGPADEQLAWRKVTDAGKTTAPTGAGLGSTTFMTRPGLLPRRPATITSRMWHGGRRLQKQAGKRHGGLLLQRAGQQVGMCLQVITQGRWSSRLLN